MKENVTMWVFTWESYGGRRVEGASTKREAKRLRGELSHHPCGALVRVVLPSPRPGGGGE